MDTLRKKLDGGVTPTSDGRPPIIEARNITKHFGHVHALQGADFTLYENEVVALIGDNGAGKSTLTKILCGVQPPTSGDLLLDGAPISMKSPLHARELGIETVYQDLALALDLDSANNLFLGQEVLRKGLLGKFGFLDDREMTRRTVAALRELGVSTKIANSPTRNLSGGQRQGVAIARAVAWASKVVLMDEPTAALGVAQTQKVLDHILRLKQSGRSVVLISHNMPDVLEVSDRIQVLRLGKRVAQFKTSEVAAQDLVAAMTGALDQTKQGGDQS